jgi:putative membrane protein
MVKRLRRVRQPSRPAADDIRRPGERRCAAAAEGEPDYRFTLANERTFLAWQRTALGLLAAAVAVVQLVPAYLAVGLTMVGMLTLGLVIS